MTKQEIELLLSEVYTPSRVTSGEGYWTCRIDTKPERTVTINEEFAAKATPDDLRNLAKKMTVAGKYLITKGGDLVGPSTHP